MPKEQFSGYIIARKCYIWCDDDVRFVLEQHAKLDFHSASSLKQHSEVRHFASFRQVTLIYAA